MKSEIEIRRALRRLRDRALNDYHGSSDTIDTRVASAVVDVYEGIATAFGIELGQRDRVTWGYADDPE